MNSDYEKTLELVDNIDKLLQQHLQEALQEEEKQYTLSCKTNKTNKSLKAKRDYLLQAKNDQLKIIKFSLDKLTAKHQEAIDKEGYAKISR